MPVERAADHPTFEIGGNAVTSLAAPQRGSDESALFRIDLPAGGGLPPHRHDHFDVFTVTTGTGTMHLDDEATEIVAGEGHILTAGAIDSHVHFISPNQIPDAFYAGITTLIGGGTGPARVRTIAGADTHA